MVRFYLQDALFVSLLMLPILLCQKRFRYVGLALLVFLAAELMVPWMFPHYLAPIMPLVFLLVVQGMRHLNALTRQGHAWARFAVPGIMLLHGATLMSQYVPMFASLQRAGIGIALFLLAN